MGLRRTSTRVTPVLPPMNQIQAIIAGAACILNLVFLRETRSDILLLRRAQSLTKQTGQKHVPRGYDSDKGGWRLIAVSCLRPIRESPRYTWDIRAGNVAYNPEYLFTEPIVSALSTWIGFAWAMIFLGGTSVGLVFKQYGWNQGQLGMAQLYVCLFMFGFSSSLRGFLL